MTCADRTCIVVDDMIDTGGTISKAVKQVLEAGANKVVVAATHGVLSDPAAERLADSGACEVVLTNTLAIPPEHQFEQLTVLSIAPLIAKAIHEVFEDGSVTSPVRRVTASAAVTVRRDAFGGDVWAAATLASAPARMQTVQ